MCVCAVIRAFVQLRPSERKSFTDSCQNELDIATLMVIAAADFGESKPAYLAPGVAALDPARAGEGAAAAWEDLWCAVGGAV